ncbi:MAG: hypothetical protein A2Y48_05430 [Nitrospirae bacterium RIFCSPLOW2_12_42_9]|nr:MAG: hypothetical protein A2Y48_05430 [Nitrospirae bacterium RIFCSPLOW2_12_42_9]
MPPPGAEHQDIWLLEIVEIYHWRIWTLLRPHCYQASGSPLPKSLSNTFQDLSQGYNDKIGIK